MNCCYYPFIQTTDQLNDNIARASWYLNYIDEIEKIYFFTENLLLSTYEFKVPSNLDPNIISLYKQLKPKIEMIDHTEKERINNILYQSDCICRWKRDEHPSDEWKQIIAVITSPKSKKPKVVYDVDKMAHRFEGSVYIKIGRDFYNEKEQHIALQEKYFHELLPEIGQHSKSYIFGTGPSVDRYKEFDFSDGLSIICNSIILDKELMDYVKPKILVFADPIFHFGCSLYAFQYREQLYQTAAQYNLIFIIPFNYYRIFINNCPELKDRTIAIPMEDKPINLDLKKNFYIRTISNILTLLLLPVAATLSQEIHLIGFDGRKTAESKYFWKHNPKTQIVDQMENIKKVHPAFFSISYNTYYESHQTTLRDWLKQAEKIGKAIHLLTPSYIPTLRRYYSFKGDKIDQVFYPLISIIILNHNQNELLSKTLTSILEQKYYDNYEVIIVAPIGAENQKSLPEAKAPKDKRIKTLIPEKQSKSQVLNVAITKAQGEYITFLYPGDQYYPDTIALLMEAIIDNGYDGVFSSTKWLTEKKNEIKKATLPTPKIISFLNMEKAVLPPCCLFLKKEAIVNAGLFDTTSRDDVHKDLIHKLLRMGVILYHVPNAYSGSYDKITSSHYPFFYKKYNEIIHSMDALNQRDERIKNKAHPIFQEGLGQAIFLYQKAQLSLELIIKAILNDTLNEDILKIANSISPLLIKICIDKDDFEKVMEASIVEYYQCAQKDWLKFFRKEKSKLVKGFSDCFKLERYPFFYQAELLFIFDQMEKRIAAQTAQIINPLKKTIQDKENLIQQIYTSKSFRIGHFVIHFMKKTMGWIPFIKKKF